MWRGRSTVVMDRCHHIPAVHVGGCACSSGRASADNACDMTPGDVTLRPMRHDDIADGLRLCRLGGWDQVARDWEMFLDGPDAGGIVATLDERIVATAATLRFGQLFGWIGMVLVDPAVQGRG